MRVPFARADVKPIEVHAGNITLALTKFGNLVPALAPYADPCVSGGRQFDFPTSRRLREAHWCSPLECSFLEVLAIPHLAWVRLPELCGLEGTGNGVDLGMATLFMILVSGQKGVELSVYTG